MTSIVSVAAKDVPRNLTHTQIRTNSLCLPTLTDESCERALMTQISVADSDETDNCVIRNLFEGHGTLLRKNFLCIKCC